MLISKQLLIAGSELARLGLSHKADIEEWKPGWAPLKYFPGRESGRLSVGFVACQVSALINVGIEVGVEGGWGVLNEPKRTDVFSQRCVSCLSVNLRRSRGVFLCCCFALFSSTANLSQTKVTSLATF